MGQRWSEGDEQFYASVDVETLLIHGRHDRLVSPAYTQLMHEVVYCVILVIQEKCCSMNE